MPLYLYQNKNGDTFEFIQGINEKPYNKHPETNEKIFRVIGMCQHIKKLESVNTDKGNPDSFNRVVMKNTLGSLIDKNSARTDWVAEQEAKREESEEKRLKELEETTGIKAIKPSDKKTKGKIPWWRDGSVRGTKKSEKPVDLSNVKDISKYIVSGDKDG
jgi:hypothetical protein